MNIIQSVGNNQQEIINNILQLHNNGNQVDLDCTYSKGVFYKNGIVKEPLFKSDLEPQLSDVIQANSENLPFNNERFKCIIYDPPFVISGKTYKNSDKDSCKISKRFSCYHSWQELKDNYTKTLTELNRILQKSGIIIVKCQNTISSGKQHWTHYMLIKYALEIGLSLKDEFILHNKSKMTSFGGRWKTQQHAMKHHSYFLVFKKEQNKISY